MKPSPHSTESVHERRNSQIICLELSSSHSGHILTLGILYRKKYKEIGEWNYIEKSIQALQEALSPMPSHGTDRASKLNKFGTAYGDRYKRIGAEADLENFHQLLQGIIDLNIDVNHSVHTTTLELLSSYCRHKCQKTGLEEDPEGAIQLHQASINLIPCGHPDLAIHLHQLELGYRKRYQRIARADPDKSRDRSELEQCIELDQKAIDVTPSDHPQLCLRLFNVSMNLPLVST
ncbi:hypothetical protein HD806DRAFT_523191 [Xylariaceae sp. AK1471]|nr:hypothetical protein HD806DRAFT_523191 [Xylariaceae sp. AK1471]